jgi:lipoprotein-anchoring transpeptidase ErfK/SrfK
MRIAMFKCVFGICLAAACTLIPPKAQAGVLIRISRASQILTVTVDGARSATWAVSTARRGYHTPAGSFRPRRLEPIWYSSKYESSPMPHSIFFLGGYAIHGTYAVRSLGRPVSHGCVRLSPAHARQLFDLVRSRGMAATRIIISMMGVGSESA